MKTRPRRLLLSSILIFLCGSIFGCATPGMVVHLTEPLLEGQKESIYRESDLDLARQAIPANLKVMEGMLHSDPGNRAIQRTLAEGFCSYAFSFVEEDDPERASNLYLRGFDYALLSLSPAIGIEEIPNSITEELIQSLVALDRPDMPGLFWATQCWAGWVLLNLHDPFALAEISQLGKLMHRLEELDETYHYAWPHLLLGGYYGSRTKLLGGQPEKARFHFERNIELNEGKFLLTYIIYAKTYAVQMQDRDLYQTLLQTVLDALPNTLPEQRLANEIAKEKAQIMLEMIDDIF